MEYLVFIDATFLDSAIFHDLEEAKHAAESLKKNYYQERIVGVARLHDRKVVFYATGQKLVARKKDGKRSQFHQAPRNLPRAPTVDNEP